MRIVKSDLLYDTSTKCVCRKVIRRCNSKNKRTQRGPQTSSITANTAICHTISNTEGISSLQCKRSNRSLTTPTTKQNGRATKIQFISNTLNSRGVLELWVILKHMQQIRYNNLDQTANHRNARRLFPHHVTKRTF